MTTILPRQPSRFEGLMGSLNRGLSGLTSGAQEFQKALGSRRERETLAEKFGDEFRNVRDPNIQKTLLGEALEKRSQEQQQLANLKDYQTLEKNFGKEFADLYQSASIGGKTRLLEAGIDAMLRGEKIGGLLGGEEEFPEINEVPIETTKGEKLNIPNFTQRPQGYTPKEWAEERKTWRKENSGVFDTAKDRLKANERDVLGTKKLQKLNESGKLPSGFSKLIINPKTGDIRGLAQLAEIASPEAQEWVKEIARFGNRAKDAFGSRVTNFDLFQYMKQFPSLLNTSEGRRRILKMMQVNYQLDNLYDKAIRKIYDQTGLSGIPPEEADKLARQMISNDSERLKEEYLNLDEQNINQFQEEGSEQKRPSLEEIFG